MANSTVYCLACGKKTKAGNQFCTHCGALLTYEEHSLTERRGADDPAGPHPVSPAKGRRWLPMSIAALIVLACVCGGMALVGRKYTDRIAGELGRYVPGWGQTGSPLVSTTESLAVGSGQAGTLRTLGGGTLDIPAGAVPRTEAGAPGEMVFSIEEDHERRVNLPGDGDLAYEQVGPLYNLGPEGFTFDLPVRLSFPIPENVDPGLMTALTYFDAGEDTWRLVPAAVHTEDRTVQVHTTHLSLWGSLGGSIIAGPGTRMPDVGGSIIAGPGTRMPDVGGSIIAGPGTRMPDVGGSIIAGPGTRMPDVGGSINAGPGTRMPDVGGSIIAGPGTRMPDVGGSINAGPGTRMPDVGGSILAGPGTRMPDVGGSIIAGPGTRMPDVGGSILAGPGTRMPDVGGDFFNNNPNQWLEWQRQNGGWVEITNILPEKLQPNEIEIPGREDKRLPVKVWYGVCIEDYAFDNPAAARAWVSPRRWSIGARSGETNRYYVPAGMYSLSEYYGIGETDNTDFDYLPKHWYFGRPLGQMRVAPGETLQFSRTAGNFVRDGFESGRPTCWGEQTTSVGTGDVQVTLTWRAQADIDLYVEDPTGNTVSYSDRTVPSGGELDRDNKCSNFIMGRPENIFWPTGGAPSGSYNVNVHYFGDCANAGPVAWTVRTVVMGRVSTFQGTLGSVDDVQDVTTFTVP